MTTSWVSKPVISLKEAKRLSADQFRWGKCKTKYPTPGVERLIIIMGDGVKIYLVNEAGRLRVAIHTPANSAIFEEVSPRTVKQAIADLYGD
jgi:hypothetical protein